MIELLHGKAAKEGNGQQAIDHVDPLQAVPEHREHGQEGLETVGVDRQKRGILRDGGGRPSRRAIQHRTPADAVASLGPPAQDDPPSPVPTEFQDLPFLDQVDIVRRIALVVERRPSGDPSLLDEGIDGIQQVFRIKIRKDLEPVQACYGIRDGHVCSTSWRATAGLG